PIVALYRPGAKNAIDKFTILPGAGPANFGQRARIPPGNRAPAQISMTSAAEIPARRSLPAPSWPGAGAVKAEGRAAHAPHDVHKVGHIVLHKEDGVDLVPQVE